MSARTAPVSGGFGSVWDSESEPKPPPFTLTPGQRWVRLGLGQRERAEATAASADGGRS